jgi:hypothetical protein
MTDSKSAKRNNEPFWEKRVNGMFDELIKN